MNNSNISKPCLVETRQGFSVSYQEKPLYSKYAPKDSIKKLIDNLTILPNTLILCFSPVLGYGLEELLGKLLENCFILALEKDKNLYDFSLSSQESLVSNFLNKTSSFLYMNADNPIQIAKLVNGIDITTNLDKINFPKIANFKRVIPLEFSGGAKLYPDFYKETTSLVDESISQFWKNRTTLMKLGRLYAGNFFKNLQDIAQSQHQEVISYNKFSQICSNKHILVLGTGLSLDDFLPLLKSLINDNNIRKHLFIIAVDASLPVVGKYGIIPDLVVGVEGQLAIEKAYIGFNNSKLLFASDLVSRPSIKRILKGNTFFFLSKYTSEPFIQEFLNLSNQLNIPTIEPLGSVGLVAVELALLFRNPNNKIFCCGTDFSFIPGKTHCKGAPVHNAILSSCNRLSTTEQLNSSFTNGTFYINGKSSFNNPLAQELTSKALYNYALHFAKRYSTVANIFDLSDFGVITGLPKISFTDFINSFDFHDSQNNISHYSDFSSQNQNANEKKTIKDFLRLHHQKLLEIKQILTGKQDSTNLSNLLLECGYLYLHFPDGHNGPKLTPDFLKRIRAEVELFLKITKL